MSKTIILVILGIIVIVSAVWIATSLNDVFIAQRNVDEVHRDVEQAQVELDQAVKDYVPILKECINANGYDVCRNAMIDRCVSQGEASLNECTELFELVEKEL